MSKTTETDAAIIAECAAECAAAARSQGATWDDDDMHGDADAADYTYCEDVVGRSLTADERRAFRIAYIDGL